MDDLPQYVFQRGFVGLSDDQVKDIAAKVDLVLQHDIQTGIRFCCSKLFWEDRLGTPAQRCLFRQCLSDNGTLRWLVLKAPECRRMSFNVAFIFLFRIYAEFEKDRRTLMETEGLFDMTLELLTDEDVEVVDQAIGLLWSFCEDEVVAAHLSPRCQLLAPYLDPEKDSRNFPDTGQIDVTSVVGTVHMMCTPALGAKHVACSKAVVDGVLLLTDHPLDQMIAFFAACCCANVLIADCVLEEEEKDQVFCESVKRMRLALLDFNKRVSVEELHEIEQQSEYRWISIDCFVQLIRHWDDEEVVWLGLVAFGHLLYNIHTRALLTPDDTEYLMMLQWHPAQRVRDLWKKHILPFFEKTPYPVPSLQKIAKFKLKLFK